MESAMILVFFFLFDFPSIDHMFCVLVFFWSNRNCHLQKTTDNELDVFKSYAYIYTQLVWTELHSLFKTHQWFIGIIIKRYLFAWFFSRHSITLRVRSKFTQIHHSLLIRSLVRLSFIYSVSQSVSHRVSECVYDSNFEDETAYYIKLSDSITSPN